MSTPQIFLFFTLGEKWAVASGVTGGCWVAQGIAVVTSGSWMLSIVPWVTGYCRDDWLNTTWPGESATEGLWTSEVWGSSDQLGLQLLLRIAENVLKAWSRERILVFVLELWGFWPDRMAIRNNKLLWWAMIFQKVFQIYILPLSYFFHQLTGYWGNPFNNH